MLSSLKTSKQVQACAIWHSCQSEVHCALLTGLLGCAQDLKSGGVVALELVRALLACVVAGTQEQAQAAAEALSCDHGIMGAYFPFLAVVRNAAVSRSGRAVFEQAPLLTVLTALQYWASATDGACRASVTGLQRRSSWWLFQDMVLPAPQMLPQLVSPDPSSSAAHTATPGWVPARQLIIDLLEEVLDIQKGVKQLAERDGLISPVGWQLRLQIAYLLVSYLSRCTAPSHPVS